MRFRIYWKANHAASMRMRDTIDVTSRRRHLVTQREQKGGKRKKKKEKRKEKNKKGEKREKMLMCPNCSNRKEETIIVVRCMLFLRHFEFDNAGLQRDVSVIHCRNKSDTLESCWRP